MRYCSSCGTIVRKNENACSECGTVVRRKQIKQRPGQQPELQPEQQPEDGQEASGRVLATFVASLIILAVGAVLIWLSTTRLFATFLLYVNGVIFLWVSFRAALEAKKTFTVLGGRASTILAIMVGLIVLVVFELSFIKMVQNNFIERIGPGDD
jgi:hypothetical protein